MHKLIFIIAILAVITAPTLQAREIPINPITGEVRDKLKESVRAVAEVDSNVEPMVKKLQKSFKSYEPCADNATDRGCIELKKQVGEHYEAVLTSIARSVPELKKTLNSTAQELGRSIEKKTRRPDVRALYENISKKKSSPVARGPLSLKLKKLMEALGSGSSQSILEVSLQTQADLIAATSTLEMLEGKVNQLLVMVDLGQELPILSNEIAEVMQGVSELFGYEMDFVPETLAVEQETAGSKYAW